MSREDQKTPGRREQILLVEDQAIIALSQAARLKEHGYHVEPAFSGESALQAFKRSDFDLVLMDIDLGGGIDGIETAKEILEDRQVPIVFLTSHSEREVVEKVTGVTRYGYVLKSATDHVLVESIRMAFELFEAHQELERSRDLYKSSANLTGDVIIRANEAGEWYFMNREGERVWGIKLEEVVGQEFWHLIHPDDRQHTREAIEWMMRHAQPVTGLVNRNSTVHGWRRFEWNASPIFDRQGNPEGFQATGRDVSEREEYRKDLRLKTHAITSSANGIAFADRDFNITYANPAALALWGFEDERQVIGRSAREFLSQDEGFELTLLKAVEGESQVTEQTGVRADGTPFDVEVTVSGIRDEGEDISALMAILVDITDRKRQQREISELLQEKELLISEFRHRIKNDMSLIRSLLRLQATYVEDPETAGSIIEAADRISVLTRVYDRIHTTQGEGHINARTMLTELVKDLRGSTIPETAAVNLDIDEVMVCDRGSISLGLIVNELITNAVKYAGDDNGFCQVEVQMRKNATDGLNLSVSDDGPGYPTEVINGSRHGYGLTVVQELVAQHNGTLQLKNGPGATTQIRALLSKPLDSAQDGCVA